MRLVLQFLVVTLSVVYTMAISTHRINPRMHPAPFEDDARMPMSSNSNVSPTMKREDPVDLSPTRRLQQTVSSPEHYKCPLGKKLKSRLHDEESHTWTIDDALWKEIGEDLQAIINCTKEGDVVLLNITKKVAPRKRIEIPWKLTLSGMVYKNLVDDKIPETEKKTRITCHDSQGVFYIRSSGVHIANIICEGCNLSVQDTTNGIIEVADCQADGVKSPVELHHTTFADNRLNGTSAFYTNDTGCSVKMGNIHFRNNSCRGICLAHLSGSSILQGVTMSDNQLIEKMSDGNHSLIFITTNSTSEIRAIESRRNNLTALHFHKSSVTVKDSTFAAHSGSSPVHLTGGRTNLTKCHFENNTALTGAALYIEKAKAVLDSLTCIRNKAVENGGCLNNNHSTITIRSSKIANNEAYEGGGIHSLSSTIDVHNSVISFNRATGRGAGIHANSGHLTVQHTSFQKNSALLNGGAMFYEVEASLMIIHSSFRSNSAGVSGGAIVANSSINENVTLINCRLLNNRAKEYAGALQLIDVRGYVQECTFEDNSAKGGGAINTLKGAYLEVVNSSVSDNKATKGGGIYATTDSELKFIDSKLDSNRVHSGGGGLYALASRVNFYSSFVLSNHCDERGGGVLVVSGGMFNMTKTKVGGNVARNGGGGFMQSSRVHLNQTTFIRNHGYTRGGGLYLSQTRDVVMTNTSFLKNDAFSGGGLFHFSSKKLTFNGGRVDGNKAEMLGGGLACKEKNRCVWELVNLDVGNNVASYGGGIYINKESTISIHWSAFYKNQARNSGGAVHANTARSLHITNCDFNRNSANEGGAVVAIDTPTAITDCRFKINFANVSGAAIGAWDNSTLTINRVNISSSKAVEGGAIHIYQAELKAEKLMINGSNVTEKGGGIFAKKESSVLCSECTFQDNVAGNGAAVAIRVFRPSDSSKFQFIDCKFQRNTAQVGGAVFFDSEDVGKNCASNETNCTLVFFAGCGFVRNKATRAGGALFARFPLAFRYTCDSSPRKMALSFYDKATVDGANVMLSNKAPCPIFKLNRAVDYGDFVGSYARKLIIKSDGKEIDTEKYVISHRSGSVLQTLELELRDQYLGHPVVERTQSPVKATMESTNNLITGALTIHMDDGKGTFKNVRATGKPGNYSITIDFDDKAVKSVSLLVTIQECIIGEYSSKDGDLCLNCTANQFNFHPKGKDCFLCPSNADCSTRVILPSKGYANRHPCSQHVQSCLAKSACDFLGREQEMERSMRHLTACPKPAEDNALIAHYTDAQCREGHKGPLCGSCHCGYAQTQASECKECFSPVVSVMLLTLAVIFTLGLNVFAVRTSLPPHRMSEAARSRRSLESIATRASGATDVEMVGMLQRGNDAAGTELPTSTVVGLEDIEKRTAMAKGRVTEIFKVVLNFVQVVAVAASINSNWTQSVASLFSFADLAGGVTDAAGFSSSCLASDDGSVSRGGATTLVSLAIPLAVLSLFVAFWIRRKVVKSESWAYLWERCLLSLLSVGYLSYVSVTKTAVGVLYCVSVYDGVDFESVEKHKYWAADTSVRCFEGQHVILAASVGIPVLIIFSVGFPLIVVAALVRHGGSQERRWLRNATRFLYGAYDEKYVFWESLVMLRKAALATIVVFGYPLGSDIQGTLAVIALTLALFFHSLCRPYRLDFDSLNQYELWSLATSLLTFASGLLFNDNRLTPGIRAFLTIFVISMVCGLLSFLLFKLFVACADYSRTVLEEEGIEGTERWTHLKALRTHAKVLANERLSSVTQHLYQSVPLAERIPVVRVFSGDSEGRRAEGVE